MDLDDRTTTPRQFQTMSMEQTVTAPLNNTVDFLVTIFVDWKLIFVFSSFCRVSAMIMGKQRLPTSRCSTKLREKVNASEYFVLMFASCPDLLNSLAKTAAESAPDNRCK